MSLVEKINKALLDLSIKESPDEESELRKSKAGHYLPIEEWSWAFGSLTNNFQYPTSEYLKFICPGHDIENSHYYIADKFIREAVGGEITECLTSTGAYLRRCKTWYIKRDNKPLQEEEIVFIGKDGKKYMKFD